MGFMTLEDTSGTVEIVVFPDVFAQCSHLLNSDEPIIVQGTNKKDERGAKIIAEAVDDLDAAQVKYTSGARIVLQSDQISRRKLEDLKKMMHRHHGPCPVSLTLHFTKRGEVDIDAPSDFTISPSRELAKDIEKTMGYAAISYIKKQTEIQARNGGNNYRRNN